MTTDGYIACQVYSGGINGDTFNSFVEDQLLSVTNFRDRIQLLSWELCHHRQVTFGAPKIFE